MNIVEEFGTKVSQLKVRWRGTYFGLYLVLMPLRSPEVLRKASQDLRYSA